MRLRQLHAIAAAVIAVVLLGGCAGEAGAGEDAAAAEPTPQVPTAEPEPEPEPTELTEAEDALRALQEALAVLDRGTTPDNPHEFARIIHDEENDRAVRLNSLGIADEDILGNTAAPGHTLLVVSITESNLGTAEDAIPWAAVYFVAPDGLAIPSGEFTPAQAHGFFFEPIPPGMETTGNLMFEVPTDWHDGLLAVFPNPLADPVFLSLQ